MPKQDLEPHDGILVLTAEGPPAADSRLMQYGRPRGILIHEKALRAWSDLGALLAHLQSIKKHYPHIEKVAVIADRGFGTIIPFIANHFIHAQVKHFDRAQDEVAARDWLVGTKRAQARAAA